jgi:glycogen debranching enzyme
MAMPPVRVRLSVEFENDFVDIFEVRGFQRERRGETLAPTVGRSSVELGYRGLDGAVRRTRIQWSVDPVLLHADRADFEIEVGPRAKVELETTIACALEGAEFPQAAYAAACRAADTTLQDVRDEQARSRARTTSSTRGCTAPRPTSRCSRPATPSAAIRTPACRGTASPSGATASSPPCSTCG